MSDFIAAEDHVILAEHRLDNFDALWALELTAVDAPNTARGGYSSVARLQLGEHCYYLKRQTNHLTRSLRYPFGEPTFAREFRNIQRYEKLGIPALQAAFFARRRIAGKHCAILLTRALDGWHDLEYYLQQWSDLPEIAQLAILRACGELANCLHGAGQVHGCFYPKHIFLRPEGERFSVCLIDLEKTYSALWLGHRERARDLEPLLRRASAYWGEPEVRALLAAYAPQADVELWLQRLGARRRHKEKHH